MRSGSSSVVEPSSCCSAPADDEDDAEDSIGMAASASADVGRRGGGYIRRGRGQPRGQVRAMRMRFTMVRLHLGFWLLGCLAMYFSICAQRSKGASSKCPQTYTMKTSKHMIGDIFGVVVF